jgi:hypothetical protein
MGEAIPVVHARMFVVRSVLVKPSSAETFPHGFLIMLTAMRNSDHSYPIAKVLRMQPW